MAQTDTHVFNQCQEYINDVKNERYRELRTDSIENEGFRDMNNTNGQSQTVNQKSQTTHN